MKISAAQSQPVAAKPMAKGKPPTVAKPGERTFAAELSAQLPDDAHDEFDDVPTQKIPALPNRSDERDEGVPQAELDVAPTPTVIPILGKLMSSPTAHRGADEKKNVTATAPLPATPPIAAPQIVADKPAATKAKSASHAVHAASSRAVTPEKSAAAPAATDGDDDLTTKSSTTTTATAGPNEAPKPIDVSAIPLLTDTSVTTVASGYSKPTAAATPTSTDQATPPTDVASAPKADPRPAPTPPFVAVATTTASAPVQRAAPTRPTTPTAPTHTDTDPATRGHIGANSAEITVGEGADRVTLRIAATHHTVRVEALAASPEMQSALKGDQSQLRDQLARHGLDLDFHSGASPHSQSQDRAPSHPTGAPTKQSTTPTPAPTATTTASAGVRVVA